MFSARRGALLFVAAACLIAAQAGDTSIQASSYVPPYRFEEIGRVLGPSDVGAVPGPTTGTSDVTAIGLPDGRVRIYFLFGNGTTVTNPDTGASAISNDGTHFTIEPGLQKPAELVFTLPDGRYRLFYAGCIRPVGRGCELGLFSETSSDGLHFTVDPGVRLNKLSPYAAPLCTGIVQLADGVTGPTARSRSSPSSAPNVRRRRVPTRSLAPHPPICSRGLPTRASGSVRERDS